MVWNTFWAIFSQTHLVTLVLRNFFKQIKNFSKTHWKKVPEVLNRKRGTAHRAL
jgi:hypothetical protein